MTARSARINLFLCAAMHGLNHYLMIFYKPMYPELAGFFGLTSVAQVTTRLTLAYIGYGISNFLTGLVARRFSLKNILAVGMLVMSLSVIAFAFVPGDAYALAVVFVFLMGLGGGTYHPAANTLMTSLYESKRGHAIGILSIGSAVGFIIAPIVGTTIGKEWIGFHDLFLVSGLVSLSFAAIFFLLAADHPAAVRRAQRNDRTPLAVPKGLFVTVIVLVSIPTVLRDLVSWGYYEVTPYWVEAGFSGGIGIGLVQLMAYLPGPIVQPLAGKLSDKLGAGRVVTATVLVTGEGFSVLAVPSAAALWCGLILYGIGMSASTVANETFMASLVTAKHRGLVYGIVLSLALGVGGYLGGASGWIVDAFGKDAATGYRIWYAGMGLLLAASVICYVGIQWLTKKKAKGADHHD